MEEGKGQPRKRWTHSQYARISDVVHIVMSPGFVNTKAWSDYLANRDKYKAACVRSSCVALFVTGRNMIYRLLSL